jgi:hypothetical protein
MQDVDVATRRAARAREGELRRAAGLTTDGEASDRVETLPNRPSQKRGGRAVRLLHSSDTRQCSGLGLIP